MSSDHVAIQMQVSYFDAAADPELANALHKEAFSFSADMPADDFKADIIGVGQNVRAAIAHLEKLRTLLPAGTTGLVP